MNRSTFLKRLGLGIVAIPLIPKIAAETAELVGTITIGDVEPSEDTIVQEGSWTNDKEAYAEFRMMEEFDRRLFMGYERVPVHELIGIVNK